MGRVKKSIVASILLISMLLSIFPIDLYVVAETDVVPSVETTVEETVTEEGYIKGSFKLVSDGEEITEMMIGAGGKEYVYTELVGSDKNNLKYTWQILINEERNRWATINDYLLSYAVISEALIENQPNNDGHATIRCIADDGENKYVSGNLEIIKTDGMAVFTGYSFYNTRSIEGADEGETTESTEGEGTETTPEDPDENESNSNENPNIFNIVINYVFRHADNESIDNTTASSTFTVTLPTSSSYTGTVTTPHVTGYTPYFLDNEDGTFSYGNNRYSYAGHYSFKNQSENITITIYYIPNEVRYTVKYYEQNLYDDEYTYAGFETKTGYTDTYVSSELDVERDGFTPLAYNDDEFITGDGETVVEIYYDRLYCLVDVELGDGGHGVVPYYVRHDTQIILGTPTRLGYTFRGWELTKLNDKAKTELNAAELAAWEVYAVGNIAGTMITINQSVATELLYTAKWETATTTYSAIYWVENADDTGYTLWGYKVYDARPGDVVSAKDDMEREDKECFTFNEHRSDKNITVKGDGTTAVNVYYTRNHYSLVFKASTSNPCAAIPHQHNNDCKGDLICGIEISHEHGASCGEKTAVCGYVEHIHGVGDKEECTIDEHLAHTESCLACTKEEHAHTWECYNGATSETSGNTSVSGQAQDGYIGRSRSGWWGSYTYWIYVKGTWYKYNGNVAYGSYATPNSRVCPGEHTHSDENKCYNDEIHIHNKYCCSIPEHVHNENYCFKYSNCDLKAHKHDEHCYCECHTYVHTHTDACTDDQTRVRIIKVITAKYGADISSEWPIKCSDGSIPYSQGNRWDPDENASTYTEVLVYIPFMPGEDITFTANAGDANKIYTMNYYLEALPGATDTVTFEGKQYVLNNSIKAKYNHLTYAEDFFDITGFTQYKVESGGKEVKFTSGKLELSGSEITVNLYYSRNEYEIVHNNNGIVIDHESHISKYQASISNHGETPDYPSNMEPGACYFDGWYYTPTCADGTKVDFKNDIMPAGDVVIYSKWSPEQYNVKVYMDEHKNNCILDETVYFNEMVVEPKLQKDNVDPGDMPEVIPDTYIFAGWYYMDGNVEKRFDFNTMMIKRNYEIYAKWTSLVPVNYVVYYRVKHADGEYEDIAEPERGQALVGISKTFSAKTGEDLKTGYTTGYYPEARSASILMKAKEEENVYVFIYEHCETINYSVTHTFVDNNSTEANSLYQILGVNSFSMTFEYEISNASDTPAEVVVSFRENVTEANVRNAIKAARPSLSGEALAKAVDAAWGRVKNFSPDAYERREILITNHTVNAVDEVDSNSDNKIYFNWSARTESYPCQVVYYIEDLDASPDGTDPDNDYTRYSGSDRVDYLSVGTSYTAESINITGFTLDTTRSQTTGTVTAPTLENDESGLILRLYYNREMYSYTVQHDIGDRMITITRDPVRYGTTVMEYAKDVPNETDRKILESYYVEGQPHQHLTVEGRGQVITFRYRLHIIYYRYLVVGDGDGVLKGSLSLVTEEVDANATPNGSIPTAKPGYVFAGWFTDEAGTIPVTDEDAHVGALHNTIIPIPSPELAGETVTFYAKFVPTHIVIQNNNVKDEEHTFIYTLRGVAGTNTAGINLKFAIVGNGSVKISNLPIGDYTLTTNCDWSYRYNESEIAFSFFDNKVVWVDYHDASQTWIGDHAYSEVR